MNVSINQINDKGKIVYEYNPLFNYRVNSELLDLITPDFKFSLKYPLDIQCQTSYDGSVNLILNDGLNKSKLINTRFRVCENNTYEVINRSSNNDANLYDKEQFNSDTALVKSVKNIPQVLFSGLDTGGLLPCGSYNFYFKYEDDDGNETDFIGESGSVVCHIGFTNEPSSIRSGLENENSGKAVNFTITNIDDSYKNLRVYYSRRTSSAHNEPIVEYKKIANKYTHQYNQFSVRIDGNEQTLPSSLEEINKEYFRFDSAKTQVLCGSRLFLGNLNKTPIDYKEFNDISLRILPYYNSEDESILGAIDSAYIPKKSGNLYYNTKNIYNNVGYWNEEIYRLGIVYILNDDSLTPVFNIRGRDLLPIKNQVEENYTKFQFYDESGLRSYVDYDVYTSLISNKNLENAKGVVRINDEIGLDKIYSFGVYIPDEVLSYMQKVLNIKGYFIVRLKRIANLLTQAFVIGHEPYAGIPILKVNDTYQVEGFTDSKGILNQMYKRRLKTLTECDNLVAICPDYQVRLELYNNFFTNTNFTIREIKAYDVKPDEYNERCYYAVESNTNIQKILKNVPIIGVPDSTGIKRTDLSLFRSRVGAAESYNFETLGGDFDIDFGESSANNGNIVRGEFCSYLGLSGYKGECNRLINIYVPEYSEFKMSEYFKLRYQDSTPYYAITDRIIITQDSSIIKIYRGDCYICQFTQRLHRNFQDPNAPTNDTIVDKSTLHNYTPRTAKENLANINIGDLNAINIGSWLTFKVRSSMNLSMRDYDGSRIEESLLMGNNRSFFPFTKMSADPEYKLPDSSVINTGISLQLSEKVYFEQPEVPYLKTNFLNRICYSDVSVIDSFKNGYRTFQSTNYRDYSNEFGGIMKLVEWLNSIVVVFEHGIGILPINERVMTGSGVGGDVFLNTNNVLPLQINMITTDYGTQWPDSVVKTEFGIYGVDTVAKKIWKFANNTVTIISERKVQKFLNENITFSERTLTPIIGICNLKTHYNKFKRDVMFTFYNRVDGIEELAWNLCFNEYTQTFVTFYSWIPSFSENIDNIFFSYDRNTSKKLAGIDYNSEGPIALTNIPILKEDVTQDFCIAAKEGTKVWIEAPDSTYNFTVFYTEQESEWAGITGTVTGTTNKIFNWECKDDLDEYLGGKNSENGVVIIPMVKTGDGDIATLFLRGNLPTGTTINVTAGTATTSGTDLLKFSVSGNIRSLVDYIGVEVDTEDNIRKCDFVKKPVRTFSLKGLLKETRVTDATNLLFTDVILYESAFESLFENCTELKFGPRNLPANVLFDYAYKNMFNGCENLILGPNKLVAEYVGNLAYEGMFRNCKNLINIIKLKAAVDPPYSVQYKTLSNFKNSNESEKPDTGVSDEKLKELEALDKLHENRLYLGYLKNEVIKAHTPRSKELTTEVLDLFTIPVFITNHRDNPNRSSYYVNNTSSSYKEMFAGCSKLKYVDLLDINNNDTIKHIVDFDNYQSTNNFDGIILTTNNEVKTSITLINAVRDFKSVGFYNFTYYLTVLAPVPLHNRIDWKFSEKQVFNVNEYLAINDSQLYITDFDNILSILNKYKYIPINIEADVYKINADKELLYNTYKKTFYLSDYENIDTMTSDFWKHGLGGIIDIHLDIKPSTWYDEVHPFEFEYVVREDLDKQKTFDSLQIISNNIAPESFHYEIIGDSYDFSLDKLNMYVRQELTKELYQLNGSDIVFNRNYKYLLPEVKQRDTYVLNRLNSDVSLWKEISLYKDKSTLFPAYYRRNDTFNEVYDFYTKATSPNKNYSQLSGTEITYDLGMSLFNLVNHVEAVDMKDPILGRLRGNMLYLEDKWYVQINPINFVQKNENEWRKFGENDYYVIPLNVQYLLLHNDIKNISTSKLPKISNTQVYHPIDIDTSKWSTRKEVKLKDKYMKVKIRYNTNKLALIVGVNTLYRI